MKKESTRKDVAAKSRKTPQGPRKDPQAPTNTQQHFTKTPRAFETFLCFQKPWRPPMGQIRIRIKVNVKITVKVTALRVTSWAEGDTQLCEFEAQVRAAFNALVYIQPQCQCFAKLSPEKERQEPKRTRRVDRRFLASTCLDSCESQAYRVRYQQCAARFDRERCSALLRALRAKTKNTPQLPNHALR